MRKLLDDFLDRYFHDEESIILIILLAVGLLSLALLGGVLAPLIASVIIAYLMQGLVNLLLKRGVSHVIAFSAVYALFIGIFVTLLLVVAPVVWNQLRRLINELPNLVNQWQSFMMLLPENYPSLFTEQQVGDLMEGFSSELGAYGQAVLEYSLASLPSIFAWMIFLVLVPILVFFVMKDQRMLVSWAGNFLPRNRPLMTAIWKEMDQQIANYVRGKVVEIFIVGAVSYVMFVLLDINYAALLAVLVGLSVIVPYIGATVVTLPVAAVAFVQWGVGSDFYTVMVAYMILQILDGNVLVPIIFSEAVNLHPIAIIVAVLVFGGLWGLAGVFFAIPLATFIKAVMNAWPSRLEEHQAPAPSAEAGEPGSSVG